MIKKEIHIFFTALMFYTRIPCPKWLKHEAAYLNKATKYFPLIGWIVGLVTALTFKGAYYVSGENIAIVVSIIAGVLTTGAFHEDGFADVCDGFGGGWSKQRILDIMKDSRVGAYGVIGISLLLLLKFTVLGSIVPKKIALVLWAGHSFSRLCPVLLMYTSQYVRENDDAKAKPLATNITLHEFLPAVFFGLAPFIFLGDYRFITTLGLPLLAVVYLRYYFHKWIGGYTGDCLGATQQITEVLFYFSCVALFKWG
jgi:adenosylcobinamide-GDP ribazoletransferase